MADQKISQMAAAGALTGAEEFPLVQSGGNRKATYATLKADLYASPGLTGTPVAPTPSPGANTTQIPTTAWVLSEIVAALTGLSWKQPCRVATTAAGTLATSFENGDAVDGVTLAAGDRILIKDQAAAGENGIYVVAASGAPTRATDCDSEAELIGAAVFVTSGTANGNKQFTQTTDGPITVGTTALVWVQIGTNGGVLTDGDKGDILVSGGGTVFTIDPNAVTLAQMVQIPTDRLLGRDTAGTGNVETLTVGGGLEFTGSGGVRRSALTGDVTAAAGGTATTIANDAVTYAKLQNVSATSRVLGRKTAGAGDAEELTFSEVLDFVGGAVQGDLLVRNATAWVRLAAGTSGHVLTTYGAGANPGWAAAGGGGGVADGDKGDITVTGSGATWTIDAGAVSNGKFRTSAALSVVGNSTNATAAVADIAAGSDHQVLRRSGTAVGFGAVNLASSNAVTGALPRANLAAETVANQTLPLSGSGDTDDLANPLGTESGMVRVTGVLSTGNWTGMTGAGGQVVRVVNTQATSFTFKNQSTGSAAANRFQCNTNADIALAQYGMAELWYDGTTQRWRVAKFS